MATAGPDGRPHETPLWGVWVDGTFWFDGIPTARSARNMAVNPAISVHLESASDAVVLDGDAEDVEVVTEDGLANQIVDAWTAKYGDDGLPRPAEPGMFRLRPRMARRWTRFPNDATRWEFGAG